jgi:P-type E1-E2 ATPase
MLLGIIRELFVEIARWKEDEIIDNREVKALFPTRTITQEFVTVGDVISLQHGDRVPADCILLEGETFTSSTLLDGERNFKPKKAPLFVSQNFEKIFCDNPTYKLQVESLPAEKNLFKFEGRIVLSSDGTEEIFSLSFD